MNAPMRLALAGITASLSASMLAGCARHEPPAPRANPSVALPEPEPPSVTSGGAGATMAAPARPGGQDDGRALAANPSAATIATAAASTDPQSLPQTRDVPRASGPAFEARVAALWDAIVADDPERAMGSFFPLASYEQVKDVANPASDWKHRLVAAYAHDIHTLHRVIADAGGQPRQARFVALDVPEGRARWVEPGEEYNRIGYFRVFGSKLRYELDGAPHTLDVKSLISWRGEWYVVHLSSIR